MQSQTRLIQEAQGVGDPGMPLLLRVLIVDVRAGADLGECETRLRTTTTLLPAASTMQPQKTCLSLGVIVAPRSAFPTQPRKPTLHAIAQFLLYIIIYRI